MGWLILNYRNHTFTNVIFAEEVEGEIRKLEKEGVDLGFIEIHDASDVEATYDVDGFRNTWVKEG